MIVYIFHTIHIFKVMHCVFIVVCFIFFTFLTRETFFHFPFTEYPLLDCKQNVVTGIDTMMSISDGLGPSIFCRRMEKVRPMREEMDGEVLYFPPESAFLILMLYFKKYFSLFVL